MKWKNLPISLRGGIIAVIIAISINILLFIIFTGIGLPIPYFLPFPPLYLLMIIYYLSFPFSQLAVLLEENNLLPSFVNPSLFDFTDQDEIIVISGIFSVINLFLIGALIGWIVGRVKTRQKAKNLSNNIKANSN